MVINIIKDNLAGTSNLGTPSGKFIIKTICLDDIFKIKDRGNIFSIIKEMLFYVYYRFLVFNHYYKFHFYSTMDNQNYKFLFSPEQVVVISDKNLGVLNNKMSTAYYNTFDLFYSLFIYYLSSNFGRFENYEKILFNFIYKTQTLPLFDRIIHFINYLYIKYIIANNHSKLIKIYNSPSFNYLKINQKKELDAMIQKSDIVLKYIPKFRKYLLLFGVITKRKMLTSVITVVLLTVLSAIIFTISAFYGFKIVPYLFLLQFIFIFVLIWLERRK